MSGVDGLSKDEEEGTTISTSCSGILVFRFGLPQIEITTKALGTQYHDIACMLRSYTGRRIHFLVEDAEHYSGKYDVFTGKDDEDDNDEGESVGC